MISNIFFIPLRRVLKWIGLIFISLLLVILILLVLWVINSPGKPDPITDSSGNVLPNSISVIETVNIGGIDQHLIIRGRDISKPVILFVHGGPGGPEFAMMKATNQLIENDFVMVYWEQRGAGKSYDPAIPVATMNLEQFISDTGEISKYLIKKFNKEKIYLMGHSWGTMLGILTAERYPELFHAYFGVGQIGDQYEGERVSFEWVKERARLSSDKIAIEELNHIKFPDKHEVQIDLNTFNSEWDAYIGIERQYVMKYGGGAMKDMKSILPLIKMIFLAKEYTVKDKINYLRGSDFSNKYLWKEVIETNLFNEIDEIKIPVYILQGLYDYQTPYSVAKKFYDQLNASEKQFYTFENSAHSPNFEEVEQFNEIVRKLATEN